MTSPFRKQGECLPDRPLPPSFLLPKPPGKRMWINMLKGRGRDLRRKPSMWKWLDGVDKVPVLVVAGITITIVVAVIIAAATGNLDSTCQCSCSPEPCTCQCQGNY